MNNKFLPIGTVFKVYNEKVLFMIVGYCSRLKVKKINSYDYICCVYPVGMMGFKKLIPVKHDKIEKIQHMGYNSQKLKNVNSLLKNIKNVFQEVKNEGK